jgi:flavin-dependent dehydrogenase
MSESCDVLVIGGGPAGSSIAAILAEKNWRVVLVEKDRHPRFHIGESLLPLSLPYLERLGVLEEVEKIGLRKYAAEFDSIYHGKCSSFPFSEALDKSHPYAYEVKRAEFDHILLKNAAAKGAEVHEGCRVTAVELDGDRAERVSATDEHGKEHVWHPRFLVDASGRDTFLADRLGTKERNKKHSSAAIFGHFEGAERRTGQAEGNISIYWFDHGWFWMIPLKGDLMSVGAVCWPYYLKSRRTPVEQFLFDTIALCPPVQARLKDARLVSPVTATGNYSYTSKKLSGKNYLLVGDAFAFIDPVFSSGVHFALHGALSGAETVDGILREPETAEERLKRYEKSVRRGLKTFSWFIYRITTPAMRDLIIHPHNRWRIKEGVISLLAGDLFRNTPLASKLLMFKIIYYLKSLADPINNYAAHKRRRQNIAS